MFYVENNPLDAVYADLAAGKTPTPFDRALKLKGTAQNAFTTATCREENVDMNTPGDHTPSRRSLRSQFKSR